MTTEELHTLIAKAENGDVVAMNQLTRVYGTERQHYGPTQALKWFKCLVQVDNDPQSKAYHKTHYDQDLYENLVGVVESAMPESEADKIIQDCRLHNPYDTSLFGKPLFFSSAAASECIKAVMRIKREAIEREKREKEEEARRLAEEETRRKAEAEKKAIDSVVKLINAIGEVEFTEECDCRIRFAREAYDDLPVELKQRVDNDVLISAQTKYDKLRMAQLRKEAEARKKAKDEADQKAADVAVQLIESIGKVECSDECTGRINAASKAYNALNNDQKYWVKNINTLTSATNKYKQLKEAEKLKADQKAADVVVGMIEAIGMVNYSDECLILINTASKAYNALNDEQKCRVKNINTLTSAVEKYKQLQAAVKLAQKEAREKADEVIDKINAIGAVDLGKISKIQIARLSYNALNNEQKQLVSNLDVLVSAEKKYNELHLAAEEAERKKAEEAAQKKAEADQKVADVVIKKINFIGEVIYAEQCFIRITVARKAYDALTTDQKKFVSNYDLLTSAEQKYQSAKAEVDRRTFEEARKKAESDRNSADVVIKMINAIGQVTCDNDCFSKLVQVHTAYDKLDEVQKKLVSNHTMLVLAEKHYSELARKKAEEEEQKKAQGIPKKASTSEKSESSAPKTKATGKPAEGKKKSGGFMDFLTHVMTDILDS